MVISRIWRERYGEVLLFPAVGLIAPMTLSLFLFLFLATPPLLSLPPGKSSLPRPVTTHHYHLPPSQGRCWSSLAHLCTDSTNCSSLV